MYSEQCYSKVVYQFGGMDLTQEDQCAYIDAGCGGLVKPSLYSWDCLDTTSMTPIQASFVTSYLENCEKSFMGDDGDNGDDDDDEGEGGDGDGDGEDEDEDQPSPLSDDGSTERSTGPGHSSSKPNAWPIVGGIFGGIATAMLVVFGIWRYKISKAEGPGIPMVSTFSPMVFSGRPEVSFTQLKTEVVSTGESQLSSGAGQYTAVEEAAPRSGEV